MPGGLLCISHLAIKKITITFHKTITMISEKEFTAAEDIVADMPDEEFIQMTTDAVQAQPAIFTFIAAYYESLSSEDGKDFYIHLVYSIWLAYNKKYKLKKVISIAEIEKMEKEEEDNLNKLSGDEEAMFREALRRTTTHPQAAIFSHIYTLIAEFYGIENETGADNPGTDMNEAGIISGVMNTYINLLEIARNPLQVAK